jgi:phosphoglycolate phosphatase-like HAD superfamily hydrolase
MIGDRASDVAAGHAAGCGHTIRFGPDVDGADGSSAATVGMRSRPCCALLG